MNSLVSRSHSWRIKSLNKNYIHSDTVHSHIQMETGIFIFFFFRAHIFPELSVHKKLQLLTQSYKWVDTYPRD